MIITIFTDSHLGFRHFKKDSSLPMAAFRECIQRCLGSDVTIHTGDLFDSTKQSPFDVRQAQLAVRYLPFQTALFGASGHILMIAGNHEKPQSLDLLDCALVHYVSNGTIIPNFYLVADEILVVYASDYIQNRTQLANLKLARADPFFAKNPQFAALPRVGVLLLHQNNNGRTSLLDLQFVHDFNQVSETKIRYVINGHEHDYQIKMFTESQSVNYFNDANLQQATSSYQSDLTLIQPGSFIRTKIDQDIEICRQYKAEHFVQIDTSIRQLTLSSISSKQVAFKCSHQFSCSDGISAFSKFVEQKTDEAMASVFQIEQSRFLELDEQAVAFAADRAQMDVSEFRQVILNGLKAKNTDLYKNDLLFKPVVIVQFIVKDFRLEHKQKLQTTNFEALYTRFEGIFENDNFLELAFEEQQPEQTAENPEGPEIKSVDVQGFKMDYAGISIVADYVKGKIDEIQQSNDYVGDVEASVQKFITQYVKELERRMLEKLDAGLDLEQELDKIMAELDLPFNDNI